MTVAYSLEGHYNPPRGVRGGRAGAPRRSLEARGRRDQAEVPRWRRSSWPGERIVSVTSGGGGYGDPLERDPALVLDDVLEGWVSGSAQSPTYGVVLRWTGAGRRSSSQIDDCEATGALRASRCVDDDGRARLDPGPR